MPRTLATLTISFVIAFCLTFQLFLPLMPSYAEGNSAETRFFKNATVTVNGLTCFSLALNLANTTNSLSRSIPGMYLGGNLGIRVWKRDSAGLETEITAGTPVATVPTFDGDFHVLRSATWNCSQTSLATTDSIVVRVYCRFGTLAWALIGGAIFTTEQLGATQLDAATWTCYYYVSHIVDTERNRSNIDFTFDGDYPSRIEGFKWTPAVVGYALNLRVMDWDLTDVISNAKVTMNNGTDNIKYSDANGWANYTGVSGSVTVTVHYFGFLVNGTSLTVSADTTLDLKCKLYDCYVQVLPSNQQGILYTANVTVFNSTSSEANKIRTALSNETGYAYLPNLPNNTLTFTVYAKSDYSIVIANVTRTPTSDEQTLTAIVCDQNYGNVSIPWELVIIPVSAILQKKLLSKRKKRLNHDRVSTNRLGNSDFLFRPFGSEFSSSRKI